MIFHLGSCSSVKSANTNNVLFSDYVDDDTYFICLGNELLATGGSGGGGGGNNGNGNGNNGNGGGGGGVVTPVVYATESASNTPISGYIKSVAGYLGDI